MSISGVDTQFVNRPLGRGAIGGILLTLAIHGALGYMVYMGQVRDHAPPVQVRDLIVTKMVTRGKPPDKFWLPRIVTPPPPPPAPDPVIKVAPTPTAPPVPPPPVKPPPPKPEEKPVSSDLKRALARAKQLERAAKEEPAEGSLTGSLEGTTTTATEGDEYATKVHDAIKRNWSAPSGLLDDAQLSGLKAEVSVTISEGGQLGSPRLTRPSGNELFDDSCLQAVRATGSVPPVPAGERARYRRGIVIEFEGKDLAR